MADSKHKKDNKNCDNSKVLGRVVKNRLRIWSNIVYALQKL